MDAGLNITSLSAAAMPSGAPQEIPVGHIPARDSVGGDELRFLFGPGKEWGVLF